MEIENNLNEKELDLIKTKKRHIKVIGRSILGLLGLSVARALELSSLIESGFLFIGKSTLFMGLLPVPNYVFLVLVLLASEGILVKGAASKNPENKNKGGF